MGVHGEIVVTATHLNRLGDVPKVFGHIHKAQEPRRHLRLLICRMDFGETEEKRFIVAHFTRKEWALSRTRSTARPASMSKANLARRVHLAGDEGPGGAIETAIKRAGAALRSDPVPLRAVTAVGLDQARVLAEFAEALRVEVEPIAVPDRQVRSPQVAEARTLEAKLAAYLGINEVEPRPVESSGRWRPARRSPFWTQAQNELTVIEAGERAEVAA